MSAFLVSQQHVSVLAIAMVAYDIIAGRLAPDMAGLLYEENIKSVVHRYPKHEAPSSEGFTFVEGSLRELLRIKEEEHLQSALLKAVDGLMYQSCEHDGWDLSASRAFCLCLKAALYKDGGLDDGPTYERADTWSVRSA